MIRRKSKRSDASENVEPRWFDDFELRLGDIMRGERATMGKSLLDVQRELRIKAGYIAAIENADPGAFDTPGFIAGYVRSYARYLGMNPDRAFAAFCAESGFTTAHGMSDAASSVRKANTPAKPNKRSERDPMFEGATPFAPGAESVFSRIEPGAVGSLLVLVALVGALGFGGWTVLNEVQRVQLAPVENTPDVLADLDPLAQVQTGSANGFGEISPEMASAADRLDRLYRPQALDVPVLVARDAPIVTLKPSENGSFTNRLSADLAGAVAGDVSPVSPVPSVSPEGVVIVAARPSWVRINDAAGGELFSGILNTGDTFDVAQSDGATPARIRVGESGSIYYIVQGKTLGPTGPRGAITEGFSLAAADLLAALPEANIARDPDLSTVLAGLGAPLPRAVKAVPQVLEQHQGVVTVIATREVWLRVRAASGTILHEGVMQPGDFYTVPQTAEPSTIRAGDAGAVYFAANGSTYGPYGARGAVADNLKLTAETVTAELGKADWETIEPLARAVAQIDAEGAFGLLAD
ncbi:helix-turn-helix domain-containing protein [uncultured Lentibacter sp.]|uniref:helix-turn-helix domain-containing protein n=1 Tax=uncultured Lentibacter sp. TaxID=1659309 RepID=UPI00260E76BD|nr:helix-turn-helix domain-containing protein [uncultured Lentibacter sp.]